MTTKHMQDIIASALKEWATMIVWIERLDMIARLNGDAMLLEQHGDHQYERPFEYVGLTRLMASNMIRGQWRAVLNDRASETRRILESHYGVMPETFERAKTEVAFAMDADISEAERAIFGGDLGSGFRRDERG